MSRNNANCEIDSFKIISAVELFEVNVWHPFECDKNPTEVEIIIPGMAPARADPHPVLRVQHSHCVALYIRYPAKCTKICMQTTVYYWPIRTLRGTNLERGTISMMTDDWFVSRVNTISSTLQLWMKNLTVAHIFQHLINSGGILVGKVLTVFSIVRHVGKYFSLFIGYLGDLWKWSSDVIF